MSATFEESKDELHKLLASAEARADTAEKACAVREATIRTICEYIDREQHRAKQAARALADAPDPIDREKAFARAHEMATVAEIVKRTAILVSYPTYVEGWIPPKNAKQVYQAFLACFQQLQDQQAMTDENGWNEYRAALALLEVNPTS